MEKSGNVGKVTMAPIPTLVQQTSMSQAPGPEFSCEAQYDQLLQVIKELPFALRQSYIGKHGSLRHLKRIINDSLTLVRECMAETEKYARD